MASEDDRPTKYRSGQILCDGELDESQGAGKTCSEVAEVEDTACPGVLLSNEMLGYRD